MYAFHGPIVHAGSAERAAVATPVAQNPVRISKVVTVFPDGVENIFVCVRMLLVDSVGDDADPLAVIVRFPVFLLRSHEVTLIAAILVVCLKSRADVSPYHLYWAGCQANKNGFNMEERAPFVAFLPVTSVSEERLLLITAHKVTRPKTETCCQGVFVV